MTTPNLQWVLSYNKKTPQHRSVNIYKPLERPWALVFIIHSSYMMAEKEEAGEKGEDILMQVDPPEKVSTND